MPSKISHDLYTVRRNLFNFREILHFKQKIPYLVKFGSKTFHREAVNHMTQKGLKKQQNFYITEFKFPCVGSYFYEFKIPVNIPTKNICVCILWDLLSAIITYHVLFRQVVLVVLVRPIRKTIIILNLVLNKEDRRQRIIIWAPTDTEILKIFQLFQSIEEKFSTRRSFLTQESLRL